MMQGKRVLITGANSGIGFATAKILAGKGAEIIAACRNRERGQRALEDIAREARGPAPRLLELDLNSLSSVREAAGKMLGENNAIDVLINNAGIILPQRELSADGYESQFATNHLGHFLLTRLLVPLLEKAESGRIINLSSGAHWAGKIHFDDIMLEENYRPFVAYSQSKLANILFTRSLASELKERGITVNAVHPGFVRSNFSGDRKTGKQPLLFRLLSFAAVSNEKGAETSVYLAESPDVAGISGEYFAKCKVAPSSPRSKDVKTVARLWKLSEELCNLS